MVYKKKGQFQLNICNLQRIVDDILRQPNNRDVNIKVKQSGFENSKSLYLYISIGSTGVCMRISDHKRNGESRQIIVGDSTGNANVYYKIESAIKSLRRRRLEKALERVGNGL